MYVCGNWSSTNYIISTAVSKTWIQHHFINFLPICFPVSLMFRYSQKSNNFVFCPFQVKAMIYYMSLCWRSILNKQHKIVILTHPLPRIGNIPPSPVLKLKLHSLSKLFNEESSYIYRNWSRNFHTIVCFTNTAVVHICLQWTSVGVSIKTRNKYIGPNNPSKWKNDSFWYSIHKNSFAVAK